jgi:hypothetical protein
LIINGAGGRHSVVYDGIEYLVRATRRSAEAAYKLAKLYIKGKRIQQNMEEATFYLKLATIFKCKCGTLAEEYHSHRISNAHPCYVTEAKVLMEALGINPEIDHRFKEQFNAWKRNKHTNGS